MPPAFGFLSFFIFDSLERGMRDQCGLVENKDKRAGALDLL